MEIPKASNQIRQFHTQYHPIQISSLALYTFDNIELQDDTGRIALIYYAKSVNIVAGGKGEGIVSNDNDNDKSGAGGSRQAAGNSTANISDNSLGQDLSSDDSFRIDGQRLYNLAIHNNYAAHYILIDVKGKGFQFYTITFG